MALAPLNRRSENVGIEPIVVSELKLRDVERQIFLADFVEASDDAALEDAPEPFNRVGVDRADNVAAQTMIDALMWQAIFGKSAIGSAFIRCDEANFVADHLANEPLCVLACDMIENAGDHIALTLHRADHWRLAGSSSAALTAALIPVFVFVA